MATYEAKIRFTDVRIITIEADTEEEARAKYEVGDWLDEHTVDFHADEELQTLRRVKES